MKERRVLVVDDEPTVRGWLAALLTHEGYSVEEAADGAAAQALLQRWRPDVIVLDLIMPGMNGRQFLLELREDPRFAAIPVLVWTAVKGVHINVTTLGATEVLEKLPDPDVMLRKIALASYRAGDQPHPLTHPTTDRDAHTPVPSTDSRVVIILDAMRNRWPRRTSDLAARGYTVLSRVESLSNVVRLARAVDAIAVMVEHSAIAIEPSLAELFSTSGDATAKLATIPVHAFDATSPDGEDQLVTFLQSCAAARRP
jgi:CheY-like chemotaxis protein